MNYNNEKELYAVYGTLKKGFGNHRILNRNPLKTETIKGFKMYSNGGFPMIVESENKNDEITIEIYQVSESETKYRLDRLEGYSPEQDQGMYLRRKVTTSLGEAWIYIWNCSISQNLQHVENGNFTKSLRYA